MIYVEKVGIGTFLESRLRVGEVLCKLFETKANCIGCLFIHSNTPQ